MTQGDLKVFLLEAVECFSRLSIEDVYATEEKPLLIEFGESKDFESGGYCQCSLQFVQKWVEGGEWMIQAAVRARSNTDILGTEIIFFEERSPEKSGLIFSLVNGAPIEIA